jgi:hypothetical protein
VIDYLFAALTNPNGRGGVFEIGGPDIAVYGELMTRYARLRGLKRGMLLLPGIPLWFMALGVSLMTPVPYPIAYALIGGLSTDSIVKYPEALKVFPEVKLIDFDTAAKDALAKTHPSHIERIWDDGRQGVRSIKHEGCFIDHRTIQIHCEPETAFGALKQFVDKSKTLRVVTQTNEKIIVSRKDQIAGKKWIEWRIYHAQPTTSISQTIFFCPRGLPGFLYWYLLYPFHLMHFRSLIKAMAKQSKTL